MEVLSIYIQNTMILILEISYIAHVTHFTKNTFINFMNVKGFNIKYINDFIHSVIYPAETNKKIINNYSKTKNILKILKIKKFFIVLFKYN